MRLPYIQQAFNLLLGPRRRTGRNDVLEGELLFVVVQEVAHVDEAEGSLAHFLLHMDVLLDFGKEMVELLDVIHLLFGLK